MTTTRVTILNSQAGPDFEAALDQHIAWGIRDLDLKDCIYGKGIVDLSAGEAAQAETAIRSRNLDVCCLSTTMFSHDLSRGESHLLHYSLKRIPDIVQIAQVLKPTFIRLLAPQFEAASEQRMMRALAGAPWLIGMYRSAIDEIHDAGFRCTIENETGRCIIGSPEEAILLFEAIDRPGAVTFTWDIQNMWEVGTYPSMDSYDILKPIIGYVHFKGGRSEGPRGRLAWRSSLGDASWPVADIAKRVACDGASPVVCINPSHGASQTGVCDDYTVADIRYLRAVMEEAK